MDNSEPVRPEVNGTIKSTSGSSPMRTNEVTRNPQYVTLAYATDSEYLLRFSFLSSLPEGDQPKHLDTIDIKAHE